MISADVRKIKEVRDMFRFFKRKVFWALLITEALTAVLYAVWIAPAAAARHDDTQVDLPVLIFVISALCLAVMVAMSFVYAFILKKREPGGWERIALMAAVIMSVTLWSIALVVIGANTDCCLGG